MFPLHINHYNKLAHFDCSLGMLEIIYVCHHRNLLLHQSKMTAALRLSWLWETGRERIGSRWDGTATGGELSQSLLDELSSVSSLNIFSCMSTERIRMCVCLYMLGCSPESALVLDHSGLKYSAVDNNTNLF